MAVQIILENEYTKVMYHEDTKIVHHVFTPRIEGEHLRESLNTGLEVLKQHGAEKWLSDDRKWLSDDRAIEEYSEADEEWVKTVWLPNVVKAGWKYWALVVPETVYARMEISSYVQAFYDMGVWVTVHTDPDEAMEWLIKADTIKERKSQEK